ncbi:MAG TPA: outer membrane protein assembly factor BamD [Acidisarcina sp.]|nr:outer membrane protein assembly factor BamD [Acidisarcina sp.]
MNRFLSRISVACLLAAFAVSAQAGNPLKHESKNTKRKINRSNPLADVKSKQPDKELFDKAMVAMKKGRYDVCRLDLQTLLNTYPESEYQMRAKLAVGDSWLKEGGTAALTQAESEYKDFITFFPNQPEAAEAQMKVADIYYMQMEKPDRDFNNTLKAEQEYRQMIQQFPDSTLVPRAKQRLREVQEVLAEREFQIGSYYATRENYAGAIARLQTVVDTYPLYSHSDMALLTLGDAYAAEATFAKKINIPPAAKERLTSIYNDRAADAYSKVVTRYPMAPHVEDAKERLIALNKAVPEPTPEALAENEAEMQSLINIKLKDRAMLLIKHGPSTIQASRVGEPSMADAKRTIAPDVSKETIAVFNSAMGKQTTADAQAATPEAVTNGTAPPRTGDTGAVKLEDVPEGNSVGATIVSAPASGSIPAEAQPASGEPAAAAPANNGLKAVGPTDTTALPPVEKPAETADQVNDVKNAGGAQVATGTTSKKAQKPSFDSSQDSSSKHKKKKGLDKLNPF